MAAAAAARAAGAVPAPAPPALPPPVTDECKHKNRLQEFAQRSNKPLPVYYTITEGKQHELRFRSTVNVDGEHFSSSRSFARRKEAEQDAAKVALEILMSRVKDDNGVTAVLPLIHQDVVFCKSILHEYSVKMNIDRPSYSSSQPQGPYTMFVASVVFDGNTYTGEVATNKKDAEQKAARAAIKSILANSTNSNAMPEIIRSKERLITAITSSGHKKERGTVIQEGHSTPVNVVPPIACTADSASPASAPPAALMYPIAPQAQRSNEDVKPLPFLHLQGPAGAASDSLAGPSCANTGQGHNMPVQVYPSAQPVVGSTKKRKKNRSGGSQPKGARVAQ